MTRKARKDLEELRRLHRFTPNPIIKFESVYRREPFQIAVDIYEMEQCLRTSYRQAYDYYGSPS